MNLSMPSVYLFSFDRLPGEQRKNLRRFWRRRCFAELFNLVTKLAGTRRGEFDLEPPAFQSRRNTQANLRMKLQRLNPFSNLLFGRGQPRISQTADLLLHLFQPIGPPAPRIGFQTFNGFRR